MPAISTVNKDTEHVAQKGARVRVTGSRAWLNEQEAARPFREVVSEPACLYARGFLKVATTGANIYAKNPEPEFWVDKIPGYVLLEEMFADEVVDGYFNLENGLRVDPHARCVENFVRMSELLCKVVADILAQNPNATDDDIANAVEATLAGKEIYNISAAGVRSFHAAITKYMSGHNRPEASDYSLRDLFTTLYKTDKPDLFGKIAIPMLEDMVVTFSRTRTDLIIWGAAVEETSIPNDRFCRGSIATYEEDGGQVYRDCLDIARLSKAVSQVYFLESPEGSMFRGTSPDNKAFRDAYQNWAFKPKANREPWKNPRQIPVHFCFSSKANINKSDLAKSESSGMPDISFGYFTSSLGESGKMNKLHSAMITGQTNVDPDVAFMFNSYLTSEDKGVASKNMTAEELTKELRNYFPQEEVTKAFYTLAADTEHKKVRLYSEFPLHDKMTTFREYLLGAGMPKGSTPPVDLVNPTEHARALELLGIKRSTDVSQIVDQITSGGQQPSPMATAYQSAMGQSQNGLPQTQGGMPQASQTPQPPQVTGGIPGTPTGPVPQFPPATGYPGVPGTAQQ